jgi:hypothetical protein
VIIPVDGEASKELVAKILGLGDGAEVAVDVLLYVELHARSQGSGTAFCMTEVSLLVLQPFSPTTFWVHVVQMMISLRIGVTRTSMREYPSSASSRVSIPFSLVYFLRRRYGKDILYQLPAFK